MARGFSFIEILISLVILISISLALLKQQWQVSQWAHLVSIRYALLVQLDNASERLLSGAPVIQPSKPFLLQYSNKDTLIFLNSTYKTESLFTQPMCSLARTLVVAR